MSTRCDSCNSQPDSPRDLSSWQLRTPPTGELFPRLQEILVCSDCFVKLQKQRKEAEEAAA